MKTHIYLTLTDGRKVLAPIANMWATPKIESELTWICYTNEGAESNPTNVKETLAQIEALITAAQRQDNGDIK